MSIYFPNISKPQYPLDIELEDTSISSKFEDGTVQSRRKFTRSRDTFTVKWEALPKSEFDTLINFIKNTIKFKANTFYWTNPASYAGTGGENPDVREVRLVEVSNASLVQLNYYSITLKLQEV